MPHVTNGSIFDDLELTESEAKNLKVRAALMQYIEQFIETHQLSQTEAARRLGITQPRLSELMRGKIDKFTIDRLVKMLANVGMGVSVAINENRVA